MTITMILINSLLCAAVLVVIVGGCLYAIRSSRSIDERFGAETVPANRPERSRQRRQGAPRGVPSAVSSH